MPDYSDSLDFTLPAAAYLPGQVRPIDIIATVFERVFCRGDNEVVITRRGATACH